jgi:serine/threonine protein kinase
MYHISSGNSPLIPTSLSAVAQHFLQQCFTLDHLIRPTAAQLLTHPFITGASQSHLDEWQYGGNATKFVPPVSAASPIAAEPVVANPSCEGDRSSMAIMCDNSITVLLPIDMKSTVAFSPVSLEQLDSNSQTMLMDSNFDACRFHDISPSNTSILSKSQ